MPKAKKKTKKTKPARKALGASLSPSKAFRDLAKSHGHGMTTELRRSGILRELVEDRGHVVTGSVRLAKIGEYIAGHADLESEGGRTPHLWGVILAHNAEGTMRRATASLREHCDALAITDTGITDGTRLAAKVGFTGLEVAPRGKVWFHETPWKDNFGEARTISIQVAATLASEDAWLLICDTDEWTEWGSLSDEQLRSLLREAPASQNAFHVMHKSGTYSQPRLIRASAVRAGVLRYGGRVHEALEGVASPTVIPHVVFCDEPKLLAKSIEKFQRDERILREVLKEHPGAPRWNYYLAQTIDCLAECTVKEANQLPGDVRDASTPRGAEAVKAAALFTEAVNAYLRARDLNGWDEEGSWAGYRAATVLSSPCNRAVNDEDRRYAVKLAVQSMERFPTSELAWLIGYQYFYLNDMRKALMWARVAQALGPCSGGGPASYEHGRTGFKDPDALYDKPFELAAFAYDRLGKPEAAQASRAAAERAREMKGRRDQP